MRNSFFAPDWKSLVGAIAFLFLSFPLGLLYFLVVIIGFSVGVGTLVVWVGLPILFITLILVRGMAEVERRMIGGLLGMPLSYQFSKRAEGNRGFLRHLGDLLVDSYTWTSIVSMLLKFPLGILSFTLVLVLPLLSASLTLMPLVYIINLFVNSILLTNGIAAHSMIIPGFIEVYGSFDFVAFARSFFTVPVGIVTWLVSRPLLTGLAWVSGEIGRALLGPGLAYSVTVQPQDSTRYASYETLEEQPISAS